MDGLHEIPAVTIITPTYNRADYLGEVIESVLGQNYPRLEYIVLDDGSTDDTKRVLERYNGRLRWGSHANMGETRTVNRGFSLATGDIIGVVNSDDPLLPGAVRTIAEEMAAHPDCVVAYPDWNMVDQDGETIQRVTTHEYSFANMVRWHHCLPGPGSLFRRKLLAHIGGRDVRFRYVGDFDFWLRAALEGPFRRIPVPLATFRVHSGSASVASRGASMAAEHIALVDKFFSMPGLPEEIRGIRDEAYSSAFYIAGRSLDDAGVAGKIAHYRRAIDYCPGKYLTEYRSRVAPMLLSLLPRPVFDSIRRLRPIQSRRYGG